MSLVSTLEPDGGRGVRAAQGLFDFGILSGHEPQPLGDETVINGAAMRMATLSVPFSATQTIKRYNNQLRNNGVLALYGKLGNDGPQFLSYEPTDSHVHRTIIVMPDGASASTVLFSVGDPSHMLDTEASIPDALPHPNGITGVVVDEVREGQQRQSDVAFTWPRHGISEAKQYYANELTKAGFRGETSTWNADQTDRWHQSFARGSETLGLTVDRRDDGVQVSMLWTHT